MNYRDYLNSEHWLNFREKALASARYQCEECGYEENLNVHHLTYENIGKESLDDVQVLCYRCHMELHEAEDNYSNFMKRINDLKEENARIYLESLIENEEYFENTDNVSMKCSSCGRKTILEIHHRSSKLGCACKDPHQRWNIDVDLILDDIENFINIKSDIIRWYINHAISDMLVKRE